MIPRHECLGCRNDYYNEHGLCRYRKTKTMVKRIMINWDDRPPFKDKERVMVPECLMRREGHRQVYIDPELLTPSGYWRNQ